MPSSSDRSVRDVVAEADQLRRSREAARLLARLAPRASGTALVAAILGGWMGWPRVLPLGLLGGSGVLLVVWALVLRRPRPASDAVAARVDRDAGLAGELRSAHWFESADARDSWVEYHVARALVRVRSVDWRTCYPPVHAPRRWIAAAIFGAGVAAIAFVHPTFGRAAGQSVVAAGESGDPLTADLRKKLEALMASMEEGKLSAEEARANLEQVKDLLAHLDPAMQKKLADLLEKRGLGADAQTARKDIDAEDRAAQAERGENSAAGMPEDVRWALEDLAARLASASAERPGNKDNPSASSETGEKGIGSAQAEQQQASAAEASMQLVREAASDPGGAKMMMGGGGPMGGDSRPGAGGNNGAQSGAAEALLVAQALRRETVEASADDTGSNVAKEDIRRKTEQGTSSLGFTRVAPPSAVAPSRADAPPPVPEARRPLLLHYFIR
jgi:hypothetical protein